MCCIVQRSQAPDHACCSKIWQVLPLVPPEVFAWSPSSGWMAWMPVRDCAVLSLDALRDSAKPLTPQLVCRSGRCCH